MDTRRFATVLLTASFVAAPLFAAACSDSSSSSSGDAGLDLEGGAGFDSSSSGGDDGGGGGGDAGGGTDGGGGGDADAGTGYCALVAAGMAPDAGPQCNALNPCAAPDVTIETVNGQEPPGTGGAITSGTYHLTKLDVYDGAAGGDGGTTPTQKHLRSIVSFDGTTFQLATLDPNDQLHTQSVAYTTGAQLTVAPTCPVATGGTQEYTATATQVMFYGVDGTGHKEIFTYTIAP